MNFQMYDFASKLTFLPLVETKNPMEERFTNAGFEFQSFILNSTDIFVLYLLTFLNFMLFKFLQKAFRGWERS